MLIEIEVMPNDRPPRYISNVADPNPLLSLQPQPKWIEERKDLTNGHLSWS